MKSNIIKGAICVLLALSLFLNYRFIQRQSNDVANHNDILEAVQNGGSAPLVQVRTLHDTVLVKSYKEIKAKTTAEKNAVTGGYADTIAQALKIALNEIDELKHINATLKKTVKLKRSAGDTGATALQPLKYSDRYLTAIFDPKNDSLQYHYNISLNAVRRKKANIWDVYSPDKNLYINQLKTFTIDATEPKHRWGLGLSAGYGYGFGGWQPYVGIGVNYNLIEF